MYTKRSSYIWGLILSLALTLAAFFAVIDPIYFHLQGVMIFLVIMGLAIIQLAVQLFCFLGLNFTAKERWKVIAFFITLGLVLIITIGSFWIMNHLNYNMTPLQMEQYMQSQQGGF